MFFSTFQNILFYYRDIKLALQHDINQNENIKDLDSEKTPNQLVQSKICHIFHYDVNMMSKLMTEFVAELVEIAHFFSIINNFSVQAMRG